VVTTTHIKDALLIPFPTVIITLLVNMLHVVKKDQLLLVKKVVNLVMLLLILKIRNSPNLLMESHHLLKRFKLKS